MKYQEALDYMESIKGYGIVPGLDSIRALTAFLGNPQEELSFVHIAGTNGKGSVLAYVSTVLKMAGYRVGRFISPQIFSVLEMFQIGERSITREDFCRAVEAVRDACERMVQAGLPHPTVFEVQTAMAFWYFREKKCDIVVLETGMGGREDATNVISRTVVSVLTSISMDHTKFLGKTLGGIAWQKAGIIKPGRPVVTAVQSPAAQEVIVREAGERGCPLTVVSAPKRVHYGLEKQSFDYGPYRKLTISLAGKVQVENAALAVEVLRTLSQNGFPVSEKALRKGLAQTKWPGRFTVVGRNPLFVVDGAHNPDAAERLAESIQLYFSGKRIIYIVGVLADKEYELVLERTCGLADQVICVTPPDNPRALSAGKLAEAALQFHPRVSAASSLEEAVEMSYLLAAKEDVIIAFGSLSYLGRLMKLLRKRERDGRK